ncbi:hypothetical protein [Pseudanabaena cinerea]|jgi:hypothetical protein|nr:hypothetical protein [Pseudanabaena cinerea]
MSDPKKWTFWDALTNANPDWWDSDDDEEEDEPDEPDDDED